MRHGLVHAKTGIVENVIVWEGAEFKAPTGYYVVRHDGIDIGDRYDIATNTLTKASNSAQDNSESTDIERV